MQMSRTRANEPNSSKRAEHVQWTKTIADNLNVCKWAEMRTNEPKCVQMSRTRANGLKTQADKLKHVQMSLKRVLIS